MRCSHPVTAMSLNSAMPFYLAVGSTDSSVRIFDRRNMSTNYRESLKGLVSKFVPDSMVGKRRRITCVDYRPDGEEILVSYSSDYIYIFNPNHTRDTPKKLYVGNPCKAAAGSKVGSVAVREKSPPPMKRLRLRGDWSDTGPNARPEVDRTPSPSNPGQGGEGAQGSGDAQQEAESLQNQGARSGDPEGGARSGEGGTHSNLMQRMTDALSRMLNDPSTRMAMRSLSDRDRAATRIQRLHRRRRQRREEGNSSDDSPPPPGSSVQDQQPTREPEPSPDPPQSEEQAEPEAGPSGSQEAASESDPMMSRSISSIQDSLTNIREQYIQR